MALAKNTSVSREAMLLLFEPLCFGVNKSLSSCTLQSMQTFVEAMFKQNCCSGYLFATHCDDESDRTLRAAGRKARAAITRYDIVTHLLYYTVTYRNVCVI